MLSGIIGSPNNLAIQADMNAQCIPQLWASTGAPDWGNIEEYPWTTGLLVPYAIESRSVGRPRRERDRRGCHRRRCST